MQHDRTRSSDPACLALKRCSACAEVKRAEAFYESRGRLSSYCKDCQRRASSSPTAAGAKTPPNSVGCGRWTGAASAENELDSLSLTRAGSGGPARPAGPRFAN
jgi:hypothetical protein